LLIVAVSAALVVPTGVAGNCNSGTLDCKMIAGAPVPLTVTVAVGGIALLAVTVNVALSTPTTDGPNVTWILQLAAGANGPVHGVMSGGGLSTKSPMPPPLGPENPLRAKVGSAIVTCPRFVTCTVNARLVFPTTTEPRFNAVGETPRIGGDNPVPVNVTCPSATPGLLVVTVNVAEVAPVA
jgi:hypothetical protein